MVVVLSTLFIDESHFEATIMVALTSMLVMYTLNQSVGESLPKTSYMKMVDKWLMFSLLMPFLVFLALVLMDMADRPNGALVQPKSSCGRKAWAGRKYGRMGKAVVKWGLVLGAGLFIAIYWVEALTLSK